MGKCSHISSVLIYVDATSRRYEHHSDTTVPISTPSSSFSSSLNCNLYVLRFGTFAEISRENAPVRFTMSVCLFAFPFVCPHVTSTEKPNIFLFYMILGYAHIFRFPSVLKLVLCETALYLLVNR
jgi:hypothetical protein